MRAARRRAARGLPQTRREFLWPLARRGGPAAVEHLQRCSTCGAYAVPPGPAPSCDACVQEERARSLMAEVTARTPACGG